MADHLKSPQKILRAGQYQVESTKFIVHAPKVFRKTKEQEIDESTARIDELREEIRALEQELNVKLEKSETEAEEIIEKAESEAERLVKQAEKSAFDRVQSSLDEKEQVLMERQQESREIINQAQNEALKKVQEAEVHSEEIREKSRQDGFKQGQVEGFQASKNEVEHMIRRLHSVIEASIDERERILIHSERQIINLVMTMVEKVVKKLTLEDQNVVVNNIKEALELVRGAMKVYIHVHPDDYAFTMEFKEELIAMIEGNPSVKFLENPSIGRGGVFIETDVGEIDATISTQLNEIQEQIRYYMPVKVTSDIKRPLNSRAVRPEKGVDAKSVESSQVVPDLGVEPQEKARPARPEKVIGNPYWDQPAPSPEVSIAAEPAVPVQPVSGQKTQTEQSENIPPEKIAEPAIDMDNSLEQSLLTSDNPRLPQAEEESLPDNSIKVADVLLDEMGQMPDYDNSGLDDIEVQDGPDILSMDDFDLDKA